MDDAGARIVDLETVCEEGSWVFTVSDPFSRLEEVLVLPCEDADEPPVRAWINRCMHEPQRLYRAGVGAVVRDGEVICPRHGSMFDVCTGYCDNGEASGTTLIGVEIEIRAGQVILVDEAYEFVSDGPIRDEDEGPQSTSHIGF